MIGISGIELCYISLNGPREYDDFGVFKKKSMQNPKYSYNVIKMRNGRINNRNWGDK